MARITRKYNSGIETSELLRQAYTKMGDIEMFFHHPTKLKSARKALSISDLHIPFHPTELLKEIIEEHSDADILFLNGDIIDAYNISNFIKEKYVPLLFEYHEALKWIDKVRRIFPLVVLIRGNHEFRMNKQVWSRLMPDVVWNVQSEADLLPKLAEGIVYNAMAEEVDRLPFDNVYYVGGEQPWWTKWGRTIICHPYKGNSNYDNKTVRNFAEKYFFGNFVDFDCIVAGHTHQVASTYVHGVKLIEQGCIAVPMAYAQRGTDPLPPQQIGYAVIYQDKDGNTIFQQTREVYLGVISSVKQGNLEEEIEKRARQKTDKLQKQIKVSKKSIQTARKRKPRTRNRRK